MSSINELLGLHTYRVKFETNDRARITRIIHAKSEDDATKIIQGKYNGRLRGLIDVEKIR